jgi:hypothetical protein
MLQSADLFTVEGWFFLAGAPYTGGSNHQFVPLVTGAVSSGSGEFGIYINWAIKRLEFIFKAGNTGDGSVAGVTVVELNTWYHFAATWDGTTHRGFINGNQEYAIAKSFGWKTAAAPMRLGRSTTYTSSWWSALNGFLDEIRITKGVARYTASFTPPAAPYAGPVYRLNDRVTVEMAAVRGALGSLHYSHTVERLPPPSGA